MSSDSGCLTASFSNNTYKSENQHGKSRNAGYEDLNDIALNEKQPYDNNEERMCLEEPDGTKNRCRLCNYLMSILSVAVLVGCAIVLYLLFSCKLPGLKCSIKPTPPPMPTTTSPTRGCIVSRGNTCFFQYRLTLRNTTEIRLMKETAINKVTVFNVTSLSDGSDETIFDQTNNMTFNVSVNDAEIEFAVHISDTQCNQQGNYSILAISDENGFEESFFSVEVIAQCPCHLNLEITSTGEISCSFPNAENTSILIQKCSGEMQHFLLNTSEIIHPRDLHTTNGFSATWSKDGTLNIKLVLGRLNCSHEGHYNIVVTMNGTSTVYDVYLHVIDHPQTPVIAIEGAGIIENKDGKISCRAMTGCSNVEIELSSSGNNIWDIWTQTSPVSSTLTNLGWETQSVTTISADQVANVDKRKFRCKYMANRAIYTSPELCTGVIPENFCKKDVGKCNYQHPYFCNKYVSCTSPSNPLERPCHKPGADT
ncbi:hypothetical protein CHS0354_000068 [Potamilus streckersoni]|uniref:Uncharacterized protein n=1 Tax=Potamilus streckersoni TaxID=2493646 RepID=A0AAE0SLK6_9BIVA|nr:hypothetical protein CHS0354_000068 [Potamilus streckersoni]